jgi:hypothetical protein
MKSFLILTIFLLVVMNATAQCNSDQKIQSPVVQKPASPSVSVNCANIVVKWQGNTAEDYELSVTVKDESGKTVSNEVNTSYTINKNNYSASIPVMPGTKVSWTMQAVNKMNNRTLYSYPLRSKEYVIPYCTAPVSSSDATDKKLRVISENKMGVKIYPNPVESILNIEFPNTGPGEKVIYLYNAEGQNVLMNHTEQNVTQINVRPFAAGTYFIRISDSNGKLLFNGKVIKE